MNWKKKRKAYIEEAAEKMMFYFQAKKSFRLPHQIHLEFLPTASGASNSRLQV